MTTKASQLMISVLGSLAAFPLLIGSAPAEKVIYSFPYQGTSGLYPQSKLVYGSGRLYGTTQQGGGSSCTGSVDGCGVVFELAPLAGGGVSFRLLYALQGGSDLQTPVGNIVFDSAGNLYGAASGGGEYGFGGVFKLAQGSGGTWIETIIHSFAGSPDGSVPQAGLTMDAAGNLYGTTTGGGMNGQGLVYELSPDSHGSWTESVLYSFGSAPDGSVPSGEVVFDPQGNIYGTTLAGGTTGVGSVYELVPNPTGGWTESILYGGFPTAVVGYPRAELLLDSAGNIFGVARGDGPGGEVFELTKNSNGSWTEKTIYTFGGPYGYRPYGGLVEDAAGNLYGTTDFGGVLSLGTIYRLSPGSNGTWTRAVVHSFAGEERGDGAFPAAGVAAGQSGVFYGTTSGDKAGTVFVFKP